MLLAFNKPYGVLSQFSAADDRPTLARFIDQPNVYPAGRLDRDSEGLLLLTDDGKLQQRISDPRHKLPKRYLAQVEGTPNRASLDRLRLGVTLKDGACQPAKVQLIAGKPGWLWQRHPPIRQRSKLKTSWLEISISEGRNRQVRRMTAAIGLPTLRLIRLAVGEVSVQTLEPGQWQEVDSSRLFQVCDS